MQFLFFYAPLMKQYSNISEIYGDVITSQALTCHILHNIVFPNQYLNANLRTNFGFLCTTLTFLHLAIIRMANDICLATSIKYLSNLLLLDLVR